MPAKFNINIPKAISSNFYLLVLAAWFITFSFIIDNYWSANSSINTVVNKLNRYVKKNEKDFFATVNKPQNFSAFSKDSISETFLNEIKKRLF